MTLSVWCGWRACWVLAAGTGLACTAQADERLVFGSFARADNAAAYAVLLSERLEAPVSVVPAGVDPRRYRVVSKVFAAGPVEPAESGSQGLFERAVGQGLQPWFWRDVPQAHAQQSQLRLVKADVPESTQAPAAQGALTQAPFSPGATHRTEFDLGLQTRAFARRGLSDQSLWQVSASGEFNWFRAWGADRHSLTVSPFFRIDSEDSERSHVDLREGYYSYIGDRFEWHLGARQVFWGVTEFNHLVDIINQTDLIENIDGEDKLGQGMVQLSLSRDWGVLDLYLLTGNRERTFPGRDGRLRFAIPIAMDDAQFESGAGRQRLDGAVRWSHYAGPLSWGLHHFSGTSRDPLLQLSALTASGAQLVPYYQIIDQTGIDGQLLLGDWAWKLEAITRSGDGDRYAACLLYTSPSPRDS